MHVRRWIAVAAVAVAAAGTTVVLTADDERAPARAATVAGGPRFQAVRRTIERVDRADGVRYDVKDDRGRNLEGLKVVATGVAGARRYVGVSHHARGGTLDVQVVTSRDLLTWRGGRTLQRDASQATVRRLRDGSYLVAWERHAPRNHVALRHYADLDALLAARHDARFDAPLTLAPTAEGTPDIRAVDLRDGTADSTIELGLHVYADGDVDRQALATLEDFTRWTARPRTALDADLDALGLRGNHGDRDTFRVEGRDYEVLEAQRRKGDWSSWRTYLRDGATGALAPLRMRFRFGQSAYGNPTASVLPGPDGGTVLFTSAFLFTEAAPRGAGSAIAYTRLR
jgi:hypothetical protein